MAALSQTARNLQQSGYASQRAPSGTSPGPRMSSSPRLLPMASRKDKTAKPIIDWITRKLGATRRASVSAPSATLAHRSRSPPGLSSVLGPSRSSRAATRQESVPMAAYDRRLSRRSASPGQHLAQSFTTNSASRAESHSMRSIDGSPKHGHPYPSVAGMYNLDRHTATSSSYTSRSPSTHSRSSLASYSARTRDDGSFFAGFVADEDASLRPMPPSRPVSPSTSLYANIKDSAHTRSSDKPSPAAALQSPAVRRRVSEASSTASSGFRSRADRSGASSTSTKPTTLLSVDLRPQAAHIAQAAPAMPDPPSRVMLEDVRSPLISSQHSLPPSPGRSSRMTSPRNSVATPDDRDVRHSYPLYEGASVPPPTGHAVRLQAPKHSQPHPRDNPRPSSPPRANASMVTLASSTFATPATPTPSHCPVAPLSPSRHFARSATHHGVISGTPFVTWADPSGDVSSNFGEPSGNRSLAGDQHSNYAISQLASSVGGRRRSFDDDASDRAVRRRGSWESAESGWSWRGPTRGTASSIGPSSIGGGRASASISVRSRGVEHEIRTPLVLGAVVDSQPDATSMLTPA